MIQALYIISKSGIPLCSFVVSEEKAPDPLLFSGLLSAIRSFLLDTNVGELKQFITHSTEVYIEVLKAIDDENGDHYGIVLLKDSDQNIPDDLIKLLIANISTNLDILKDKIHDYKELEDELRSIILPLIKDWEDLIKEDKIVKRLKEGLW